jgi:hypothetical protein
LKPTIRNIAGYTTRTGMYYNLIITVKPSDDELLRKTPFWWAFLDALDFEGIQEGIKYVLPGVYEQRNGLYSKMLGVRDDVKTLDHQNFVELMSQLIGQPSPDIMSSFLLMCSLL